MRILFALVAAAGLLCAADTKFGKPLTVKEPMPLATLLAHADDYNGKTVQVKGKITDVCQAMGCWLELVNEDGQHIRFEAHEAGIEFPKDSAGRMVIVEGKFVKAELSREAAVAKAKELAKDKGKAFDEASVKPGFSYEIEGSGALLLSK
jgi:RecJ-like exonuclease